MKSLRRKLVPIIDKMLDDPAIKYQFNKGIAEAFALSWTYTPIGVLRVFEKKGMSHGK